MKEIEKNYKKAIEKAEKTYSKELKKAALKLEKAIANAASKKDAALQRNQSEEAQKSSMEAYERAVLEAKTECETQSTNALKLREKTMVESKKAYDVAVLECNAKYGQS